MTPQIMDVAASWSLEAFCEAQSSSFGLSSNGEEQWKDLPRNSLEFMNQLGLPSAHPFCTHPDQFLVRPTAPPMGPPSDDDFKTPNILEAAITAFWYHVPPFAALMYLFAALLAVYLAPIGVLVLLLLLLYSKFKEEQSQQQQQQQQQQKKQQEHYCSSTTTTSPWDCWTNELLFHLTLFFSWLILTDDQYVLGIGRKFGAVLVSSVLLIGVMATVVLQERRSASTSWFLWRVLGMLLVCSIISPWGLYDVAEITTNVEPGIYYQHDNIAIIQVVERWKETLPDYSQVATRWQWTGDARTGLPYLMNHPEAPTFHRVWLPTVDDEYVALDIAFPPSGGHNASNPLYLVLHGLNGGSEEGYVKDLAAARTQAGSTVVVMVARGLMNTPIQGWTFFNGIRVIDAHAAASTLRERVLAPHQTLAGVGYSMGAIVLNRYVSTEKDVALDVSVSISGALCTLYQQDYHRSRRTWQRVITGHMKEMFYRGKWGKRLHQVLGREDYRNLLRAQDIVATDFYAGVLYNGYDNLTHFYAEMSSILPYHNGCVATPTTRSTGNNNNSGSRHRIPIPHLVLQALDDPLSTWRTNAANDPRSALYPANLIAAQDNIVLFLTSTGGHVGWPMGWWPHSWAFMNDYVAARFVAACDELHNLQQTGVTTRSDHDLGLGQVLMSVDDESHGTTDDIALVESHTNISSMDIRS